MINNFLSVFQALLRFAANKPDIKILVAVALVALVAFIMPPRKRKASSGASDNTPAPTSTTKNKSALSADRTKSDLTSQPSKKAKKSSKRKVLAEEQVEIDGQQFVLDTNMEATY